MSETTEREAGDEVGVSQLQAVVMCMPLPEPMRIDIDEFVWVWNSIEDYWRRTTTWTAKAFHELHPDRYTHWMPDSAICTPGDAGEKI